MVFLSLVLFVWVPGFVVAVLVIWLSVAGFAHGYTRYYGEAAPGWISGSRHLLPFVGGIPGLFLVITTVRLLSMMRSRA